MAGLVLRSLTYEISYDVAVWYLRGSQGHDIANPCKALVTPVRLMCLLQGYRQPPEEAGVKRPEPVSGT